MQDPPKPTGVTAGQFARGSIFSVGTNWLIRLIGLFSITILARILTPEDFGLVNLAISVVVLTESMTYSGVRNALIRHHDPKREDYDTAWTINFIINAVMGVITAVVIAPLAADFLNRAEIATIVRVLSLGFVFNAIRNVGVIEFEREMQFDRVLYLQGSARFLSFCIVIAAAFYYRNHWALVLSYIGWLGALALFSYVMHPYRPRFCLAFWREYSAYSFWMLIASVAQTIVNVSERILLGRVADNYLIGIYSTSQNISRIFSQEIATGLTRVTLPSFAKVKDHPSQFSYHIASAFGAYAVVIVPAALGMSATAETFIPVLLGDQWKDTAPLFSIIAIGIGLRAISSPLRPILLASGNQRFLSLLHLGNASVFVIAVASAVYWFDPAGVAKTALAVNGLFLLVSLLVIVARYRVKPLALLQAVARPCLAGGAMYALVVWLPIPADWPEIADLLCRVALGGLVYPTLVALIWLLSGRPQSAEGKILTGVWSRLR